MGVGQCHLESDDTRLLSRSRGHEQTKYRFELFMLYEAFTHPFTFERLTVSIRILFRINHNYILKLDI